MNVKSLIRCKLYNVSAANDYIPLHHDWFQGVAQDVEKRIHRAALTKEQFILLIIGPPSSGKTFLVKRACNNVTTSLGQKAVAAVNIETWHFKDDIRCMRHLVNLLEQLVGSKCNRGTHQIAPEIQMRMQHCLLMASRSNLYIIIVIQGLEKFTSGIYDCSTTTGSYSKRQGLLYILTSAMQHPEICFTLACTTCDVKTVERMEKRVKSRFVHETIHVAHDVSNIPQQIQLIPDTLYMEPTPEEKSFIEAQLICGRTIQSIATAVLSQCLLDPKFEGVGKVPSELVSKALESQSPYNRILEVFSKLSFAQHLVLVALTRLHVRGCYPQTFHNIHGDIMDLVRMFPREKDTIPHVQTLKRVFLELVDLGLVEWVNYSINNVEAVSLQGTSSSVNPASIPCRFVYYDLYLQKMSQGDGIPTHLAQWLNQGARILT